MNFAHSPYPFREFLGMAIRRYRKPAPWGDQKASRRVLFNNEQEADFWIGFVGDICPLKNRKAHFSKEVLQFFENCSMMVGNFEGIITDQARYPFLLKHTPDVFEALKEIKPLDRWVLSIANNHAMDYGLEALKNTLAILSDHNIRWVGTVDKPSIEIHPGISLTAWTWWINGQTHFIPLDDPGPPESPDFHIAAPHWGYEHERKPRSSQRENIPDGYDLIVGHHSHLPQPLEIVPSGTPVAWSLGNFTTANKLRVLGEGAILKAGFILNQNHTPVLHSINYQAILLNRDNPDLCSVTFRSYKR
ncbi:CapA family protein [Rhodohalobacter sp.]|uniref:CapA family protein n=1 Tax=Rhodohalobacter sp. TaxID=1974210 RepID=UPI002ACDA6C0|nr:CapA family protein [Rhodohalobacter sp.]MDZ7757730.1 CapA family protein [Rhodohalobacter sp.]